MVDGFVFNDFCLQCQKVMEHKVALEGNEFFAVCSKCDQKRHMINLNQVYYPKTDLCHSIQGRQSAERRIRKTSRCSQTCEKNHEMNALPISPKHLSDFPTAHIYIWLG
jgi:anion-transporting  ArsA/GET3 family ATPase